MMELSLAKRRAPLSSNKPSMLKDFLLDDLSSCSSNGFRSYPRRQCCTTVRFLLEIDMKNKPTTKQRKKKISCNKPQPQPPPGRSPLKPTGAPISAFQRASEAIINAVKHLPFPSFKSSTKYSSSSPSKLKLGILPRSLSRKFLSKRSFWKKNDHKEIQMWGPIINHLADDYEEEEENSSPPRDFTVSVSAAATVGGGGVSSNSSTSETSTTTTNSWSGSDFTNSDESLQSSTANSSTTKIPEENNKKVSPIDGVVRNSSSSKRVGVIVGGADDSTVVNYSSSSSTNSNSPPNTSKKSWPNEEKEQFSPVSVLDCPFEDDEEDEVSSSSPFQNRLARVQGTNKRLMKKIMRFELLTQLEPVNLVKRIAVSSESDQESIQDEFSYHTEETTTIAAAEKKASEFLDILKYTMSPPNNNNNNNNNIKPNTEKLLLDFFKLGYLESEKMEEWVAIAKDWVIGKTTNNEQLLDWKVKKNREMYIRDMEKSGEWRRRNKEKEEVGLEMEVEIFASLISELLDDLLL